MIFDIVGSPENENEMEEFRFYFKADSFTMDLRRFRKYKRESETTEWEVSEEWNLFDIIKTMISENITCPDIPEWVRTDARSALMQKIQFT